MNVLFVQNYPLGAALVQDTLRRSAPDIHLDWVSTVHEALERLGRLEQGRAAATELLPHYDLVLTDLNLPDGLGLEIVSHIRSQGYGLAAVVLTGSNDKETAADARRAGADDCIAKGGDYLAALPRILREALQAFRSGSS